MTDGIEINGKTKQKIERMRMEKEAVFYHWTGDWEKDVAAIARISCGENINPLTGKTFKTEPKPVKTDFQTGYLIPANFNRVDTELCIMEQQGIFECSDNTLLRDWKSVCEEQKYSTKREDYDVEFVALSREIFKRMPEMRDQIDLVQTLRLYDVLSQSRQPENQALLPEIEKNLQTKAWKYFAGNEYGTEKIRPTPYSVSCLDELRNYMKNKMNAPDEIIAPGLEHIETSMLSAVPSHDLALKTWLKRLTPAARKAVFFTASCKHPDHERSSELIEKIDLRQKNGKNNGRDPIEI